MVELSLISLGGSEPLACKGLESAVWRFWRLWHDYTRGFIAACDGAGSGVNGGGGIERLGRHVLRVVIVWVMSVVGRAVAGVAIGRRGIRGTERGTSVRRVLVLVQGMLRKLLLDRKGRLRHGLVDLVMSSTWSSEYRFVGGITFVWLARAQRAVHGSTMSASIKTSHAIAHCNSIS